MRALFDAITIVERWLRQRYPRGARVFWNQIMVTLGVVYLKQLDIPITIGNLERYTPIPSSSIHRTVELLRSYEILEKTSNEGEDYDFKGNVPKDIMDISTNSKAVEINGLVSDFTQMIKTGVAEALRDLNLQEDQIIQVTERIDQIRPDKKKLSAEEKLVGEGFM